MDADDPDRRDNAERSSDREAGMAVRRFLQRRKSQARIRRSATEGNPNSPPYSEFAALYAAAEQSFFGRWIYRGEAFIARLLKGNVRMTLSRILIISAALELDAWERAVIEEIKGYRGFLYYLARSLSEQWGITVPRIADYLDKVHQNEMKLEEIEHLLDEWVKATIDEIEKKEGRRLEPRIRAELEPKIRAELEPRIHAELEPRIRAEIWSEFESVVQTEVKQRLVEAEEKQHERFMHEEMPAYLVKNAEERIRAELMPQLIKEAEMRVRAELEAERLRDVDGGTTSDVAST